MSLNAPAPKIDSVPTQVIIASYFSLEELIHYAANPNYLDERLLHGIQAIINQYLNLLRKNNVRIISKIGDEPYMILKKTIQSHHKEKEILLKMPEISAEIKNALLKAEPFPEAHSIEDVLILAEELNKFGIINPSHCSNYDNYREMMKEISYQSYYHQSHHSYYWDACLAHIFNVIGGKYIGSLLNKSATMTQRGILLRQFFFYNKIIALGNWKDKDILDGVSINLISHHGFLHHFLIGNYLISRCDIPRFNLLMYSLPYSIITHLDLSPANLREHDFNLDDSKVLLLAQFLPQSAVTHLKVRLRSDQLGILCPVFSNLTLQSLSLRYSTLSTKDCDAFIKILPLCKYLSKLDLSFCNIRKRSNKKPPQEVHLKTIKNLIFSFPQSSLKEIDLICFESSKYFLPYIKILAPKIFGSQLEKITVSWNIRINAAYRNIIIPALDRNAELRIQSEKKLEQYPILRQEEGLSLSSSSSISSSNYSFSSSTSSSSSSQLPSSSYNFSSSPNEKSPQISPPSIAASSSLSDSKSSSSSNSSISSSLASVAHTLRSLSLNSEVSSSNISSSVNPTPAPRPLIFSTCSRRFLKLNNPNVTVIHEAPSNRVRMKRAIKHKL